MEAAFVAFYEEPEAMRELIAFLTDFELQYLKQAFDHAPFELFFQDDDWGSATSTFLSPEMMREFFLEPYSQIYGYAKERGAKAVIHHSDSYAATLVPLMIEMGIDVWQGCMSNNNLPNLINQFGSQIALMGGIDNAVVDKEDWTTDLVRSEVRRVCKSCGKQYFVPSLIQAGPASTYEGVYSAVNAAIDEMSQELFG
jgi:uroporphyrinogen-III decarboxylase